MNTIRCRTILSRAFTLASMLVLSACVGGMEDLEQYIDDILARDGDASQFDEEISSDPYTPTKYEAEGLRSPFVLFAEKDEKEAQSDENCPDPNRPAEALEAYTLDSLDMRGTFTKEGEVWALVLAPSGPVALHRVQVGNYMGKNAGRIVEITPARITLIEKVKKSGGCEEQQASVALDTE